MVKVKSTESFYKRHREAVRFLNFNFVIRVYDSSTGQVKLKGAGKLNEVLSEEQFLDCYRKACRCLNDFTWWNRKDITIKFISH